MSMIKVTVNRVEYQRAEVTVEADSNAMAKTLADEEIFEQGLFVTVNAEEDTSY